MSGIRHMGLAWIFFLFCLPLLAQAHQIRLANGVTVQGRVVGVGADGLQVQTPTGLRTFTWETLAPSTRFRYQVVFRANYQSVLRGLPPSEWTNAPDPEYEVALLKSLQAAESERAPQPATPTTAVEQAVSSAGRTATVMSLSFETVPAMKSADFPNAKFTNLDRASFVGFQYGLNATDVVYLAFEPSEANDISDVLYVYSPGLPEFKDTVRIKGFKRGTGIERRATYRKIRMETKFPFGEAVFSLEAETMGLQTNHMVATIEAVLIEGKARSRWLLYRRFTDLLQGDGFIPVWGILDLPNLVVACEATAANTQGTVMLVMANMYMVPKEGMDTKVTLRVKDASGAFLARETVKLDLFPPPADGIPFVLRRFNPGQSYELLAEIDLGPFFGVLHTVEPFSVKAAK